MEDKAYLLEQEVCIIVNGIERKYLVANFHVDSSLVKLLENSILNLQGVKRVK